MSTMIKHNQTPNDTHVVYVKGDPTELVGVFPDRARALEWLVANEKAYGGLRVAMLIDYPQLCKKS